MERIILPNFSVEQSLMKATSYTKKGEIAKAQKLYETILKNFSNNLRAQQGLTALKKYNVNKNIQNPPQEVIDQLVNLYNQGEFAVAVDQAEVLTKQYPTAILIWNILGASRSKVGMLDEAIEAYKKTISLKPDYIEAYSNLGVALRDQGKLDEAIDTFKKAISIRPDFAEVYSNMGVALNQQGKFDESVDYYKKSISLRPNDANTFFNLGIVLKDQGKFAEAIDAYKKSISLKPNDAEVHYNLGNTLRNFGRLEEAEKSYRQAIIWKSDFLKAYHNLSFTLLNSGKIKEGIDLFECRWKNDLSLSSKMRNFPQPLWDGKQSLNGKRILIWHEQGVGDTINWSFLLPFVTNRAEHCILECQEKLIPLLKRSFPNVEVKPEDRSLDIIRDDFDYHLPMGSLYKHFLQEVKSNLKPDAHLVPDPDRVNYWRDRLHLLGKGPYIGISWKSSNMSPVRLPNYSSISEWSQILSIPDVTFINLQPKDFADDLSKVREELGVTVHNFDDLDQWNNIDDVAALCTAIDMVICNHGTVPLISGGVGTVTKLAIWKQSNWNTIINNPRGNSVNIFERNTWETWDNVFKLIAQEVSKQKVITT